MALEFFKEGVHRCIRFDNLVGEGDIQANQHLIVHGTKGILLDPGGMNLFSRLITEVPKFLPLQRLQYIFLSHQDPDVGAGLTGYLLSTDAVICLPAVWLRFIPAFTVKRLEDSRVLAVPDEGMRLNLDETELILLPAHFLHSPGNLQVYDPVSKTLFSGDLGASLLPAEDAYQTVSDFEAHVKYMEGFHRRYMPSGEICREWAAMVRGLDIERIAPQHGAMFEGKKLVAQFIDWVANLESGTDVIIKRGIYQIPGRVLG